jgi:hypothetical protein
MIAVSGGRQQRQGAAFVQQEELENDLFLVAEVVVEIARADAQFGGNVVGRHIALASGS